MTIRVGDLVRLKRGISISDTRNAAELSYWMFPDPSGNFLVPCDEISQKIFDQPMLVIGVETKLFHTDIDIDPVITVISAREGLVKFACEDLEVIDESR